MPKGPRLRDRNSDPNDTQSTNHTLSSPLPLSMFSSVIVSIPKEVLLRICTEDAWCASNQLRRGDDFNHSMSSEDTWDCEESSRRTLSKNKHEDVWPVRLNFIQKRFLIFELEFIESAFSGKVIHHCIWKNTSMLAPSFSVLIHEQHLVRGKFRHCVNGVMCWITSE